MGSMIRGIICADTALKRQIADSRDRLYRAALSWCGHEMLAVDTVKKNSGNGNSFRLKLPHPLRPWSSPLAPAYLAAGTIMNQ